MGNIADDDFYNKQKLPKTEGILIKHGLFFDYDGAVTLRNTSNNNSGKLVFFIDRLNVLLPTQEGYATSIQITYSTIKDYDFLWKAHMTDKSKKEWFDIFEEIAITIAKETNTNNVSVASGRKDQAFLTSKGYTKTAANKSEYTFVKMIT